MPAATETAPRPSRRAPDPGPTVTASGAAGRARASDASGLWLVRLGAVVAFAVAWSATHSASTGTGLGRALGRLDGSLAVLLVLGAAAAQLGVTGRALDGVGVPPLLDGYRRRLRSVLVPWWLVVTVATFGFPTAAGAVIPSDAATPTWVDVVLDWLLLAPLRPPDADLAWPPGGAGRLGHSWVLTTAIVAWALLPAWERWLRRPGRPARSTVDVAVLAGVVLAVVGLIVRLVVATVEPTGWGIVARVMPPAQLDLIGAGVVVGALVAGARRGVGPLAGTTTAVRAAAPRLGGIVALALVAGAAGPASGSLLDPDGIASTVVARVGLVMVASAAALWGLHPGPPGQHHPWTDAIAAVARWSRGTLGAAFLVVPLVAQLWALRAGGPADSQRLGPLLLITVAGSLLLGSGLGAAGRRCFGTDGVGRLSPFGARLATIGVVALGWRLLTLVSIMRRNPDGGDPFYYHHQANMLVDRVGYSEPFRWIELGLAVPSAIHPPLLSTWLSVGSFVGARTFLAHKMLAAVIGVAIVVVAAMICRRLAGDRAALITAGLVAVYPNLWVIDGSLWPEGAYTTMIGLSVLAAYRWWEKPDLRRAATLGAAIAAAALTRGEALFLFPLLVVPLVWRRRGLALGHRLRAGLVAGLVGLLLLAPWTLRNLRAFDDLVLLSTNSDEVLYYANCSDTYEGEFLGYWSFNCQQRERARTGEPPGDEADKARYWRAKGIAFARDNPDRIPTVVAVRVLRELDLYRPSQAVLFLQIEGRPPGVARAGQIGWWMLAPVGVAGLFLLRQRRVLALPLLALGVMVLVTAVYAYGAVRFRTPLELALLVGAGVALDHIWARVRPQSGVTAAATAGATVTAA